MTIPSILSVMTASPISVGSDEPVQVAEDLMIDHEVRHLPVTESGALVGILSDRDIAFSSNTAESDLASRLRVRDLCSLDVFSVETEVPLDEVLEQMAKRRIGSAVVTERGKVMGLFTTTDACRCFAEFLCG